jgi:diguanylate cyclase (GGDEF)-like protein
MDYKGEYQHLLARAVAGDEDENPTGAAALGRRLAESDVDAAEVARIHAAALERHVASAPLDQRAMTMLRASRVLAEVMLWRGVAESLLRQRQWAEMQLADILQPVPASAAAQEGAAPAPFRHPLVEANAYLELVAVTDPLTGIYNARHFHVAIEAQVKAARASGNLLSLLLVDLDCLSRYNEAFGRREGDEALAALAKLLMENTRASDFVARCGGDEFAVILPNNTTRQALALAERIRKVVEDRGLPDPLTVSLGVATFPTDAANERELVNVTQQACYLAQRLGGNTVCTALVADADTVPGAH